MAVGVCKICGGTRARVCPRSPPFLGLPSLAFFRVGTIARAPGWGARLPQVGRSRPLDTIRNNSRNVEGWARSATPAVTFATNQPPNVTTPKHWRLGRVRLGNRRRPHPGAPNQPPLIVGASGVACARRLLGRTLPTQWRRRARRRALTFSRCFFSRLRRIRIPGSSPGYAGSGSPDLLPARRIRISISLNFSAFGKKWLVRCGKPGEK